MPAAASRGVVVANLVAYLVANLVAYLVANLTALGERAQARGIQKILPLSLLQELLFAHVPSCGY